jgi:hypothetical protein
MATTVIGSLAINPLLPIQARGAGSVSFGPVAIPVGYSALTVQVDLQQISSLTAVFDLQVQFSLDNGQTWSLPEGSGLDLSRSGYVLTNGVLTRAADDPRGPGPVRVVGLSVSLLHTELATRQIRGTLSCSEPSISGATFMAY